MARSRCGADGPCDGHRDGAPPEDKCPGICDVDGCDEDTDGLDEDEHGRVPCRRHRVAAPEPRE